ncbi:hypothetical protein HDU98_002329 [Podochytrium sp. JEL0797]|nr:hypothetical protein HDU98_002329 [Podochytrium sp. JEL0797]
MQSHLTPLAIQPALPCNASSFFEDAQTSTPLSPEEIEQLFAMQDLLVSLQFNQAIHASSPCTQHQDFFVDPSATLLFQPFLSTPATTSRRSSIDDSLSMLGFSNDFAFPPMGLDFQSLDHQPLDAFTFPAPQQPLYHQQQQVPTISPLNATSNFLFPTPTPSPTCLAANPLTTTKRTTTFKKSATTPTATTSSDQRPRSHECATCGNKFLRHQDLFRHESTHASVKTHHGRSDSTHAGTLVAVWFTNGNGGLCYCQDGCSPLFWTNKTQSSYVNGVFALSGVHQGSTLDDFLHSNNGILDFLEQLIKAIVGVNNLDGIYIYDMQLGHWGLNQNPGEASPLLSFVKNSPKTTYLSAAALSSLFMTGVAVADVAMLAVLIPFTDIIGTYLNAYLPILSKSSVQD